MHISYGPFEIDKLLALPKIVAAVVRALTLHVREIQGPHSSFRDPFHVDSPTLISENLIIIS